MASGATLRGFDEVIRNLEAKLGDAKVRRSANRALKGAATETLEDFASSSTSFQRYRRNNRKRNSRKCNGCFEGVPMVKLGFGAGSRWGWASDEWWTCEKSIQGDFGVIRRRFSEANKEKFKYRLAQLNWKEKGLDRLRIWYQKYMMLWLTMRDF